MKFNKGVESDSFTEVTELLSKIKFVLTKVLAEESLREPSKEKIRDCISNIAKIAFVLRSDNGVSDHWLKPLHSGMSRSMDSLNQKSSETLSGSRSASNLMEQVDLNVKTAKCPLQDSTVNIPHDSNGYVSLVYLPKDHDYDEIMSPPSPASTDERESNLRNQMKLRRATKRRKKILRWLKKTLLGKDGEDVAVIGDIYKLEGPNNNRIRLWCLVRNQELYCYRNIMDEKIDIIIPLDNCRAVPDASNSSQQFQFHIEKNNENICTFVAKTSAEMNRWMEIVKNKRGTVYLGELNEENHENEENEDEEDEDDEGYCFPNGAQPPLLTTSWRDTEPINHMIVGEDADSSDGGYISVVALENEVTRRRTYRMKKLNPNVTSKTDLKNLTEKDKPLNISVLNSMTSLKSTNQDKQRLPPALPKDATNFTGRTGEVDRKDGTTVGMDSTGEQEQEREPGEDLRLKGKSNMAQVNGSSMDEPRTSIDNNDIIAVGNSQGIIQQCKLTASSSLKDNPACQGRLGQPGAWQPEVNDKNQFLEIDLGEITSVNAIGVQGRPDYDENGGAFVKSFTLLYSDTRETWTAYKTHGKVKVFNGNSSPHEEFKKSLKHVITARYIRVCPQSWHNHIALRVELYKEQQVNTEINLKLKTSKKKPGKIKASSPESERPHSASTTPSSSLERKKRSPIKKKYISSPISSSVDGLTSEGSEAANVKENGCLKQLKGDEDQLFLSLQKLDLQHDSLASNFKDSSELTSDGPQSFESRIKLRENLLTKEKKEKIMILESLKKRMIYAKDKMIVVSNSSQHRGEAIGTEEEYLTANLELVKVKKRLIDIETEIRELRLFASHHREEQEEKERSPDLAKPSKPPLTRRPSKEVKVCSSATSPVVDREAFNPPAQIPPSRKVKDNIKIFENLGN